MAWITFLKCFITLANLNIYIAASEQAQASFSSNVTHCQWTDISGENNFSVARDELYGSSVAMSKDGQRIANVGSIESVNGPIASYVEVKQYDGNEWNLLGLPIRTPTVGSRVSDDVGLSGDGSVLIFATLYITLSDESIGDVSMYKYNIETNQWEPLGNSIPGGKIGNFAGLKVSASDNGDTVAIGSRYYDSKGLIERGRVRVFRFNSLISTWEQIGSSIIGETNLNHMGSDVELSPDGSYLIVGATGQALARIYSYDDDTDTWMQIGTDITGETGDWSGFSVGISVTNTFIRVAIGAILGDGGEGEDIGLVRLYDYNSISGQWEQVGTDIKGEDGETIDYEERYYHVGDRAGFSLSLSDDGNRIAVGSPFNNANTEYYGGHTRMFDLDSQTNDWAEVAENIFMGNDSYTLSGYSLDMSGDGKFLIIGVPGINTKGGFGRSRVQVWRGCSRKTPQPSQLTSSPSVSLSPSQVVTTRSPTKSSVSPTIIPVVVSQPQNTPTASPTLLPSKMTSLPSISPTIIPVLLPQPTTYPTTTLLPDPSIAPSFELSSPSSVHQTQAPSANVAFSPPSSIPTCYYNIENDDYDFTEEENLFLFTSKGKGYGSRSPKSFKSKGYGNSLKSSKAGKGNFARDEGHLPSQTERRINTKKTNTKSKGSIPDKGTISSKGKAGSKSKGSFSGCKKIDKYNSKKKGKGKGY